MENKSQSEKTPPIFYQSCDCTVWALYLGIRIATCKRCGFEPSGPAFPYPKPAIENFKALKGKDPIVSFSLEENDSNDVARNDC